MASSRACRRAALASRSWITTPPSTSPTVPPPRALPTVVGCTGRDGHEAHLLQLVVSEDVTQLQQVALAEGSP